MDSLDKYLSKINIKNIDYLESEALKNNNFDDLNIILSTVKEKLNKKDPPPTIKEIRSVKKFIEKLKKIKLEFELRKNQTKEIKVNFSNLEDELKIYQDIQIQLKELLNNKKTVDLLKMEREEFGTLLSVFCKKKDKKNEWQTINNNEQFNEGDEICVDFTKNGSKEANKTIGAGDILPPSIRYIMIIDLSGKTTLGIRLSSGLGQKYNRTGYYDLRGKYIPIYDGYTMKIPSNNEIKNFNIEIQSKKNKENLLYYNKINEEYITISDNVIEKNYTLLQKYSESENIVKLRRIESLEKIDKDGILNENETQKGKEDYKEREIQIKQKIKEIAEITISQFSENTNFIVKTPPPLNTNVSFKEIFQNIINKQEFIQHMIAVCKKESNFNPNAISNCKAKGLFQFMPETWKHNINKYKDFLNENEKKSYNIEGQIKITTLEMARMYYTYKDFKLISGAWHAGEWNNNLISLSKKGQESRNYNELNSSDGLCSTYKYVQDIENYKNKPFS